MRVSVVGLGAMGAPMAGVLLRSGHEVTVVPHRRREAAEALAGEGARVADSAGEAAEGSDCVLVCVPDLPELTEVAEGEGGVVDGTGGRPDGELVLLNTSTVSPTGVIELAERLAPRGVRFVDVPLSGGPTKAGNGTLTMMAAGEESDVDRVSPLLEALGENVFRTGPLGTSQAAKLCNNLLAATIMTANIEALTLARKAGLDPELAREIFLTATGGNTLLDTWVPRFLLQDSYEGGFALRLMYKDLGLARELGRVAGSPLLLGNLVHELHGMYAASSGDRDYSFVSKLYQDAAGVTLADGTPRERE